MFSIFSFTPREPYANLGRYTIGFDFRNNIGTTLWDNGVRFPDMLQNPFESSAAVALANGGEVDFEAQILNLLTGKEKCVNKMLTENADSFLKQLLSHFQPTDSEFHVFIRSVDKIINPFTNQEIPGPLGQTYKLDDSQVIQIQINKTGLASRSMLYSAKTILHEYIHAELRRRINSNQLNEDDFKFADAYIAYARQNFNADHEVMAEFYLEAMTSTLEHFHKTALKKDFDIMTEKLTADYPDGLTRDFYRRISWDGLHETETFAQLKQENPSEFEAIERALFLEDIHSGTVDEQIPCPN